MKPNYLGMNHGYLYLVTLGTLLMLSMPVSQGEPGENNNAYSTQD